jgi:hypothetical protein
MGLKFEQGAIAFLILAQRSSASLRSVMFSIAQKNPFGGAVLTLQSCRVQQHRFRADSFECVRYFEVGEDSFPDKNLFEQLA